MRPNDSRQAPPASIVLTLSDDLIDRLFDGPTQAALQRCGVVARYPDLHAAAARGELTQTEVIVTGWGSEPVDDAVLAAAPMLKAVVHSAGSVRAVVSTEVFTSRVVVSSQAEANALPVAEYTLAMILLAGKDVFRARCDYRRHRRALAHEDYTDVGNYGRGVGIVGASKIGRRVVELLRPFDLNVLIYDPFLTPASAAHLGVRSVPLAELMGSCSVVSVHAPLLTSTHHLIGANELAALPDGATLINTARGAVVDEAALLAELVTGRLQAVMDVTDPDVSVSDSPLWSLDNVFLTPHVAGALGNELYRLGAATLEEVQRALAGQPLARQVTLEHLERLA